MRHLRRIFPLVVLASALASVAARTSQTPTAPDLLKAAGTYLDGYATKVSGTTLDELFILLEQGGPAAPQRLSSDFVIVKVDVSGRLLGLRDPYAVDKKNLRPHQPRIIEALEQPTLASWEAVQGFVRENAIYMRANGVVWFSDPILALQFVATPNQSRMTYKVEGSKKINGVQVYGLGFKETERPDGAYLLGTPDKSQASGRFWIDPATGAIEDTDLWTQSGTETARVHVTYTMDPTRSVLLPHEATSSFEERERSTTSVSGAASGKIAFDASVTYSNPHYTPVDLSRIPR